MHESVSYEPPADVQKTERQVFWQLKEGLDEFLPDKAVLSGGTSFAFLFLGFNFFDQFGVQKLLENPVAAAAGDIEPLG